MKQPLEVLLKKDAKFFDQTLDTAVHKQIIAAIERDLETQKENKFRHLPDNIKNDKPIVRGWFPWLGSALTAIVVISMLIPNIQSSLNDSITKSTLVTGLPIQKQIARVEEKLKNNTLGSMKQESVALEKDIKSIFNAFSIQT